MSFSYFGPERGLLELEIKEGAKGKAQLEKNQDGAGREWGRGVRVGGLARGREAGAGMCSKGN